MHNAATDKTAVSVKLYLHSRDRGVNCIHRYFIPTLGVELGYGCLLALFQVRHAIRRNRRAGRISRFNQQRGHGRRLRPANDRCSSIRLSACLHTELDHLAIRGSRRWRHVRGRVLVDFLQQPGHEEKANQNGDGHADGSSNADDSTLIKHNQARTQR